jgi:hypothetical protein
MEKCSINRSTSIFKSIVDASGLCQDDFVTCFISNSEKCPLLLVRKADVSKSKIGEILIEVRNKQ